MYLMHTQPSPFFMATLIQSISLTPAEKNRLRRELYLSISRVLEHRKKKIEDRIRFRSKPAKRQAVTLNYQLRMDAAKKLAQGLPPDPGPAAGFCVSLAGSLLNRLKTGGYRFSDPIIFGLPKKPGLRMLTGLPLAEARQAAGFSQDYRLIFQPQFTDAVVLDFMNRKITDAWEPHLSGCCYAFRQRSSRGLNGKTALQTVYKLLKQDKPRFGWALKIDVSRYFDSLPHGMLKAMVHEKVSDPMVRLLVDQYLEQAGSFLGTPGRGVLHGYSVSGILSNIYLNRVDSIMGKKAPNIRYFRYVDDILVLAQGREALERAGETLLSLLEELGLEVKQDDRDKFQQVCLIEGVKTPGNYRRSLDYLGFRFVAEADGLKVFIRPKTLQKYRMKIQNIVRKLRGFQAGRGRWNGLSAEELREKRVKMMAARVGAYLGMPKFKGKNRDSWPSYFLSILGTPEVWQQVRYAARMAMDTLRFYCRGKAAAGQTRVEKEGFNGLFGENRLL